jgi:dolichyl-phosphate beta-glucosyltransferase
MRSPATLNLEQNTSPAISIVIPVFNEERRIQRTLADVWRYFADRSVEILVVDDGSTDGTVSVVEAFAREHPGFRVLPEKHRGKAATVLAGMRAANGNLVAFMDADLATPLQTWEQCELAIAHGAGVAIASREGTGSIRVAEPWYRHVMGRVFNGLVQLLLLPGIHDTQCGFKVFSREALDDILSRQQLYQDAQEVRAARVTAFDVELLYVARKTGYTINVIPVTWQYGDQSKVNPVTDTVQNLMDVLKVKWNDLRGRYDPEPLLEGSVPRDLPKTGPSGD